MPAGADSGPAFQRLGHDAGTVTVGAGVTNGDVHPLLEDHGMFVPTGRCPTVGVAGLVLGGGIGFSDKMFGLTCDRLLSTTGCPAPRPSAQPGTYTATVSDAGVHSRTVVFTLG